MIPLVDLARRHKTIAPLLTRIFSTHLSSGDFILGKRVEDFERDLAKFVGVPYALGVSSGTDALTLALSALDIGPGDEVIVPALTFVSTVFPILMRGAVPILVDVDPVTLTLDPNELTRRMTKKTKAVIPVHLYGMPADMQSILRITRPNKVPIIEDAAQALGSEVIHASAGSIGAIGCFSFYPAKNLGALGDAGAIVTKNKMVYDRIIRLRNVGAARKYVHTEISGNCRIDSLQASFLRAELPFVRRWNRKRNAIANTYRRLLHGLPLTLPREVPERSSNYHLFVIRVRNRKKLQEYLLQRGIQTGIHYPLPVHLQPALRSLGYVKGSFPISEQASREVLSLPMFPELSDMELSVIARAIRNFYS